MFARERERECQKIRIRKKEKYTKREKKEQNEINRIKNKIFEYECAMR